MMWTKDVFDWRSPTDKKDAIEKLKLSGALSTETSVRRLVGFLDNLKTPFRVVLCGFSTRFPAVLRVVDADGTVFDAEDFQTPFLIGQQSRDFFKKTVAVLEEKEDVPEVTPDAAELWSLLNMLVVDARLTMRETPVKSIPTLLKDLRLIRTQKLKGIDDDIKTRQRRISEHTVQIEKQIEQRKKYECL